MLRFLKRLLVGTTASAAERPVPEAPTRHQRAEVGLLASEKHFADLVAGLQDYAVFLLDPRGNIVTWNAGAERIKGYRAEEIIGQHFSRFYPQDAVDRGWPAEQLKRALAEGRIEDEGWRIRKDGSRFWANVIITALRDEAGTLWGFGKVTRDLTERKNAEENAGRLLQEEAARKAAEEEDRRKDEFLALLAHELRNPLAPLRNGLEVLRLAGNNLEAVEHIATMMERQLHHLVRFVDDLLDVSRISRGKLELRKERITLAAVVGSALETCQGLVDEQNQELIVTLPDEPVYVDGDRTRLAQVLCNLLSNAVKYSDRGSRIRLTVRQEANEVVVCVEDTGVGIPAEMLPRIFDLFTQVDRSLEKSRGGLGVGLTIVKRLVEMHGGTVEAHSEGHGMGSEFIVRLPIVPTLTKQPAGSGEPLPSDAGRRRILVVDDNVDAANSLAMMLRLMGNDVRTAHDGAEGVEEAVVFRPDVILLDIGMPRLNGYDACRRIREQAWGRNTLIFALTGWGQEDDRRRSQEAGFDGHLVKPAEPAAIERLLADWKSRPARAESARF